MSENGWKRSNNSPLVVAWVHLNILWDHVLKNLGSQYADKARTQSNHTKHFRYELLTPKNITETQNINEI